MKERRRLPGKRVIFSSIIARDFQKKD